MKYENRQCALVEQVVIECASKSETRRIVREAEPGFYPVVTRGPVVWRIWIGRPNRALRRSALNCGAIRAMARRAARLADNR